MRWQTVNSTLLLLTALILVISGKNSLRDSSLVPLQDLSVYRD